MTTENKLNKPQQTQKLKDSCFILFPIRRLNTKRDTLLFLQP